MRHASGANLGLCVDSKRILCVTVTCYGRCYVVTASKIDLDVLEVLNAGTLDGNQYRLPDRTLDRKLYLRVNAVLSELGGKWNRTAKAHLFDGDPVAALSKVLSSAEIVRKRDYGYFPTPAQLARIVVERLDVQPWNRVLEPSAGHGSLVNEVHLAALHGMFRDIFHITAVEILPELAGKISMHGHADAVVCGDFLREINPETHGTFDRIIMNPPFGNKQELEHVLHALTFLNPGGRLVAILPTSVQFATDRKTTYFRSVYESENHEILPNLDHSFRESGTDVSTLTLVIDY